MGNAQFHEMLGILFDYNDKIEQVTSQSDRGQGLRDLAKEYNINGLDEQDISDLLKGLEGILKAKKKGEGCYYDSPRN